jgi:hypothetical protein
MRCQKSKRICPGYRNPSQTNLRREVTSAKEKGRPGVKKQHASNPDDPFDKAILCTEAIRTWTDYNASISSSGFFRHTTRVNQLDLISLHLPTPIDQQAMCFFITNFVLIPGQETMRGHLDWVIPLIQTEKPNSPFQLAFSAVSLAALGARPNAKALLPKANFHYVKALKQINSVLVDPKVVADDSTLASILLFTAFEVSL